MKMWVHLLLKCKLAKSAWLELLLEDHRVALAAFSPSSEGG
jgi:hypothetical protein